MGPDQSIERGQFRVANSNLDLDATDRKGWTAVHHAAWGGSGEMVTLLAKHGAALNRLSNKDMLSPLHVSIQANTPNAAGALLAMGADKEAQGRDALRPLHFAAMRGRWQIVMLLLAHKAEVNALEANQATAIHAAAYYGHLEIVQLLLDAGAVPNLMDLRGNTARALAIRGGHPSVAALLR